MRVYFSPLITDDCYKIVLHNLINFIQWGVQVNKLKNALHVGGKFVLIEQNKVKQCTINLHGFSNMWY